VAVSAAATFAGVSPTTKNCLSTKLGSVHALPEALPQENVFPLLVFVISNNYLHNCF
jgi:hypothetical protein